jgi:2-polyprenyl-3-methyl-5-hydroxy-6-metoxy-1,4-benzoquinol methylase
MIARRALPPVFSAWNRHWGAPFGHTSRRARIYRKAAGRLPRVTVPIKVAGPFGFQLNSPTRIFEYPWAFDFLKPRPGLRVLEIGGGLSGFQFALARSGCEVHNVDPFVGDWYESTPPETMHARMNAAFETNVRLHHGRLEDSELVGPFDALCCISTLEHLSDDEIAAALGIARLLLSPSAQVVLTVDLFINSDPFTSRSAATAGRNVSIAWINELLGGTRTFGDPTELFGFPEFRTDHVLSNLEDYLLSAEFAQLAQLVAFSV